MSENLMVWSSGQRRSPAPAARARHWHRIVRLGVWHNIHRGKGYADVSFATHDTQSQTRQTRHPTMVRTSRNQCPSFPRLGGPLAPVMTSTLQNDTCRIPMIGSAVCSRVVLVMAKISRSPKGRGQSSPTDTRARIARTKVVVFGSGRGGQNRKQHRQSTEATEEVMAPPNCPGPVVYKCPPSPKPTIRQARLESAKASAFLICENR